MHASGVSHYRYSDKAKESIYLQVSWRYIQQNSATDQAEDSFSQKI